MTNLESNRRTDLNLNELVLVLETINNLNFPAKENRHHRNEQPIASAYTEVKQINNYGLQQKYAS